jgi:hypothetical protein
MLVVEPEDVVLADAIDAPGCLESELEPVSVLIGAIGEGGTCLCDGVLGDLATAEPVLVAGADPIPEQPSKQRGLLEQCGLSRVVARRPMPVPVEIGPEGFRRSAVDSSPIAPLGSPVASIAAWVPCARGAIEDPAQFDPDVRICRHWHRSEFGRQWP